MKWNSMYAKTHPVQIQETVFLQMIQTTEAHHSGKDKNTGEERKKDGILNITQT